MSGFNNRAERVGEESAVGAWDTGATAAFSAAITPPTSGQKVWAIGVTMRSNRATMLVVDVYFDCGGEVEPAPGGAYRTGFVVEWEGWNTMHFTVASLEGIGRPGGLHQVRRIRMEARGATFGGSILELGAVTWLEDSPLVRVNPYEDMTVNFLSPRMWDRSDWHECGESSLPAEDCGLEMAWMYANLWYIQRAGRRHRTAYLWQMKIDLRLYQAISVFTATDSRANFSVILDIDGNSVRAVDRRRGLGGGDEMRAEICGKELRSITIELAQAENEITEAIDAKVMSSIRWMLLERKGTDPLAVAEVRGIPSVPPPSYSDALEQGILPVGILVGREEFLRLRAAALKPGPLQKMAAEIVAEANAHLDYTPERYVGRYLPVDLGNQGCERKVSPWDQMYHFNSCMVYGAVAYALTGDLRYGQIARRALFSTLRCDTWQGGFPSRIPCGLPGYRAPFIESDTAEVVALCYDFVYNLLSKAERREVEDCLYTKALPWIDVYLRIHANSLEGSNQGAVFTAGLIYSALVARRSHPDVDAILERAIEWFPRMLGNYYKRDGSSNEGPAYWEYATKYAITALMAICRHKGWRIRDYAPAQFGQTIKYLMHVRSLVRKDLSFLPLGDNNERLGYHFMNSSLMFFARHYDDPDALWLWHTFYGDRPNTPGSTFFGKRSAGAYTSSGLVTFLLFVDGRPRKPTLEPSIRFEVCERIFLRTGVDYGDMLFFLEGGAQGFQHSHFDKGQFIVEAYGERLATDPGVVRYEDPAHLLYKKTSYHNLVTANGKDQEYKDPRKAVVLRNVRFERQYDYLEAELANSYKQLRRYLRRVLFVRPDYLLVADEVLAEEPGLEWNFHSEAPITGIDLASGRIALEGEKAGMDIGIGCVDALVPSVGTFSGGGKVISYNLRLSQKQKSGVMSLAALLLPYPKEGKNAGFKRSGPQVQVEMGSEAVTFTVTGRWGRDYVICDLRGEGAARGRRRAIGVWRDREVGQSPSFEVMD